MPETVASDLVVVGAGPGGYAAAFLAADKGLKVTLIDAAERPGGACLHVGCIPSKALLHVAKLILDAREASVCGLRFAPPDIDLAGVRGFEFKIVDTLAKNLVELCKRRKVEYLRGRARFLDSQTLGLENGASRSFGHCIIAVGSSPIVIPSLNLASPRVLDSATALKLEDVPKSLLVVGGGYIGLELGTVYAALGSRVTVVELLSGLLPNVDRDLVRPLNERLGKLFHKIYVNTKVVQLSEIPQGIRAVLEGNEVDDKEQTFDRVLLALGRRPNSGQLGLENTRVQVDEKGFIRVDEQRRTTDQRIFAIGDVAGEPMLAHKAAHEGKVAVETISGEPAAFDPRAIPAVVFTDPEIAWCGLTENEAKQQGREVKVARFPWAGSGRAATLHRQEGLTKLIADEAGERLLGVGIVGVGAGELISEAVVAIEMGATAKDLALSIHPHPTMSETLGEGAESLLGTATHLFRARK